MLLKRRIGYKYVNENMRLIANQEKVISFKIIDKSLQLRGSFY